VSKKDIDTLTDEVLQRYTNPYLTRLAVTMLINQTTGKFVHLVPLPGLEPHNVIIGFFK
jgi:hypothetical protein